MNSLLNDNIDLENKINKLNQEREALSNKISEYDTTLNEMNIYIEQLEKCNETYRTYLQNYKNEKNNIFQQNILDKISSEKSLNESLTIQNIKSKNSFYYKKSNLMKDEEEEEDEENENLKKENDKMNRTII